MWRISQLELRIRNKDVIRELEISSLTHNRKEWLYNMKRTTDDRGSLLQVKRETTSCRTEGKRLLDLAGRKIWYHLTSKGEERDYVFWATVKKTQFIWLSITFEWRRHFKKRICRRWWRNCHWRQGDDIGLMNLCNDVTVANSDDTVDHASNCVNWKQQRSLH